MLILYNLAVDEPGISTAALTALHAISANGNISSPTSFAFKLLACLVAYRALIPWNTMVSLNNANAVDHGSSGSGSQAAVSRYSAMHSAFDGSPGMWEDGWNSGYMWAVGVRRFWDAEEEIGEEEKSAAALVTVNGARKLHRSDSGWPMVDISQLWYRQPFHVSASFDICFVNLL